MSPSEQEAGGGKIQRGNVYECMTERTNSKIWINVKKNRNDDKHPQVNFKSMCLSAKEFNYANLFELMCNLLLR